MDNQLQGTEEAGFQLIIIFNLTDISFIDDFNDLAKTLFLCMYLPLHTRKIKSEHFRI